MNFLADEPVASGQQYPVTDINGRPPRALEDFSGENLSGDVCLTVIRNEKAVHLLGAGCPVDGSAVRFHQKDPGPDGKDIRVWTISEGADGTFLAVPFAAF